MNIRYTVMLKDDNSNKKLGHCTATRSKDGISLTFFNNLHGIDIPRMINEGRIQLVSDVNMYRGT